MIKIKLFLIVIIIAFVQLNAQNNKLPLIELNKAKFDFGTTKYGQNKCTTLVIRNVGDTTSKLYYSDAINKPFLGKINYTQDLKQGDSISIDICYQPFKYGKDSQRVFIRMDTRLSHSIGLLFDVSLSMNEILNDGNMRIEASIDAGKVFINSMLLTKTVYDEASIFEFSGGFKQNCAWTTDKTVLRNALSSNLSSRTAFYDAVIKSITNIKDRKFNKVLIALTDGEDNASTNSLNNCISQANANNIKVYTVGVGSDVADANLQKLATSTGGQFFRANTSKELQDIYYKIFNLLSKNITLYFDILGNSIEPSFTMDCPTKEKIINIGDTVSYPIYLRNIDTSAFVNQKYTLKFNFNKTLLKPATEDVKYNSDGTTLIYGVNRNNLDSLPLVTLKFQALVGDSNCTDLNLLSIAWDNLPNIPEIKSTSSCRLCLYSCVRDLRQIVLFSPFSISQIYPNPFSDKANLVISVPEDGDYKLSIYNLMGELLIENALAGKLIKGENKLEINSEKLESGNYYLILRTPQGNISEMISIIK